MAAYLETLNEAQREAVVNFRSPSLIIAGAGSGKTRVLTCRIAYMLEQGVDPGSIIALTFTNKAAKEMRERIGQLLSPQAARRIWMGTFHSQSEDFFPDPQIRGRTVGLPLFLLDLRCL